ncbi:transmembrane protein 41A-like isoform X2 [Xenia sp. Carnegie-2017]|uniref:transmembrane protein 41A-like isoform X2 n=1 Tax=Xenia sp. Carnegie-2017 TaxID=2897299 RepID=UPI001F049C2C|nr:transmembrane protein 41A-like isoform X2 [Xenia sp. Carnegie-2017]
MAVKRPLWSLLTIIFIFFSSTACLFVLSRHRPTLQVKGGTLAGVDSNTTSELHFPKNLEELNKLVGLLRKYQLQNPFFVFVLFCCAYLYKQTFAIPGSVFMNLLAGALYGLKYGVLFSCILTASGASFCYLLFKHFGKPVLLYYYPNKLKILQNKVKENANNLFGFLLFLRFFPMSPNWFLNMASPVLEVPLRLFFPSVLIGLFPYNYVCVQAGCLLSELVSLDELFTRNVILKLVTIAAMSLIPDVKNGGPKIHDDLLMNERGSIFMCFIV